MAKARKEEEENAEDEEEEETSQQIEDGQSAMGLARERKPREKARWRAEERGREREYTTFPCVYIDIFMGVHRF